MIKDATQDQLTQKNNKGFHGRTTITTNMIKDVMVEQLIQQI